MSETAATRKAALWVGAVFLLGAALGGVLGYLFAHHPVNAANPPLSEPERRAAAGAATRCHSAAAPCRNQNDS